MQTGEGLAELIQTLSQEQQGLLAQLEAGRDRLLELHSCHPSRAKALAKEMTYDPLSKTKPSSMILSSSLPVPLAWESST